MPGNKVYDHLKLKEKHQLIRCYKEFAELNLNRSEIVLKLMKIYCVSEMTIRKVLKKYKNREDLTNVKSKGRPKSKEFNDTIFIEEINNKIYEYHSRGQYFTLNYLLEFAKLELGFNKSKSTFRNIIKHMGYQYKKVDGRKILIEQPHLIAKKIKFLRRYLQLLEQSQREKICFVYLDETWIYQNGCQVRQWVHKTDLRGNPCVKTFKGEGKRFTILNAGCTSGFLSQCHLFLDSKIDNRDYHKTMNRDIFMKWEQLIIALSEFDGKCVVIMDNAPYHSMKLDKPPTSNSKKSTMQRWLTEHNVAYEAHCTKKELYALIKPFSADQNYIRYEVDEFLQERGHEVLRIPPYHCQYNPIEMAWSFCKNYYNKNIHSRPSSKDKVANLWLEAISLCTSELWMSYIRHCEALIKNDWVKYMGESSVDNIPPFIINLESDDSDSDVFLDFDDLDSDSNLDEAHPSGVSKSESELSDSELITIVVTNDGD